MDAIRLLLKQLNKENPGVKDRMFTAITQSKISGYDIL